LDRNGAISFDEFSSGVSFLTKNKKQKTKNKKQKTKNKNISFFFFFLIFKP